MYYICIKCRKMYIKEVAENKDYKCNCGKKLVKKEDL